MQKSVASGWGGGVRRSKWKRTVRLPLTELSLDRYLGSQKSQCSRWRLCWTLADLAGYDTF